LILVVDDDTDMRETVCLVLQEDGYRTAGACNGQEAIDWLRCELPPTVILLDLTMPVMDGCQFLAAKEAAPSLAAVPVVVMTALVDCSQDLLGHQVFERLSKPFSSIALLDAVERCARFVTS
jgi:CheY-like chemotaxis protein